MIWRNKLFFIGLLLIPSLAAAGWGNRLSKESLLHKEFERVYYFHVPQNCAESRPWPLLIAFHGGGGKAKGFARFTDFTALAGQHCFMVVYPQAIDNHWHDARFSKDTAVYDDIGFVTTLLDTLARAYPLDSRRVYLAGMSNGGVFALQLAASHPERFAGLATVAAQLPEAPGELSSKLLPSLMMINGSRDPILPYQGGEVSVKHLNKRPGAAKKGGHGRVMSTDQTLEFWRKQARLPVSAQIENLPDNDPQDGTWIETHSWKNSVRELKLIKVIGGGHTWPGKAQYLPEKIVGKTSRELDASQQIWQFLSRQKL